MRPWEYHQANAREMHMIVTLNNAWAEGLADARAVSDKEAEMKAESEAQRPQPRQRRGR